jgi:hypothetical protein
MVLTRAARKRNRERREFESKGMEEVMEAQRVAAELFVKRREVEWLRVEDEYLQTLHHTIEQHTGFPKGVVNITRDYCTVFPLAITLIVTGLGEIFGLKDLKLSLDNPGAVIMLTEMLRVYDTGYYDRIVYTVEAPTNLNMRDLYCWDGTQPIFEWFFPTQVVIRRAIRPPRPPTSPRKVYPARKLQSKGCVSKP